MGGTFLLLCSFSAVSKDMFALKRHLFKVLKSSNIFTLKEGNYLELTGSVVKSGAE